MPHRQVWGFEVVAADGQAAARLRVQVLGPVRAWRDGHELTLGPPRQRAVLAILAVRAGQSVGREELIDAVWGDDPPASSVHGVHVYVSRLRHVLEPERGRREAGQVLASSGSGYVLHLDPGDVDLTAFRHHLDRARRAVDRGDPAAAVDALDAALGLCQTRPLADISGPWAEIHRSLWTELRVAAAEDRAEAMLSLRSDAELIGELSVLVAEDPLRERPRALLMTALYLAGRQADALAFYAQTRRLLVDELGIEPSAQLQRLHHDILNGRTLARATAGGRGPAGGITPRQLPHPVRHLIGRDAELEALTGLLEEPGRAGGGLVIPVISGTAGIGKTALAVHWAHQVADRFPDGQLYVDLRGFDPTGTAMDIAEAVRGFLEAFGVPSDRIPVGRDAQLALYRTLSADRRMLVLLDNARDVEDVRPLLPVSPTALAIVTSRSRQDSLVAVEGAEPITLDLLTTAQAQQLLARRLGHNRIAAEPAAVDEIIRQCSGLPLALTIVAVWAAAHPRFPLAVLASELGDPTTRLDVLDTGDPATNVRGVFSWSYRRLSAAAARLFRLLGVHHGPDVTAAAAASLAGLPLADTRRLLAELTRTHLLTEHAPRRYSFHDLLRAYAAEQADTHDSEPERRAALHRVFDYYLHTAHGAARWLDPHRDPITLPAGEPGTQPTIIADAAQAVAWFTAERQVLLAVIDQAVRTGFDAHAWRLAWATARFLERHGHWEQWAASQQVAVDAARREADRLGQAVAHRLAGRAHMRLGRHDAAYAHFRRSMDHYRALGDDNGRAGVEVCLAQVCERQGRYRDALGHAREALDVHRASEHRAGEAVTRNMVGWFHAHLGEYEQALADCREALTVALELGFRQGEADTWDSLGYIHRQLGDHRQAITCYEHALRLFQELDDRYYQAQTLVRIGETYDDAGDAEAARTAWQLSLEILIELDHPEADQIRANLSRLVQAGSPGTR